MHTNRLFAVRNYVRNGRFVYDALALMPTDFLYFKFGLQNTFVRLPRLLKYGDFSEFFTRLDARIRHYQYILRLMKTIIYMVYLIHLNACAYYAISDYEGLGSNSFVYDGKGNAYFRCFYFATKTATSIGKLSISTRETFGKRIFYLQAKTINHKILLR